MQWRQIKTLFILCFLILDVYLVFQFLEKQQATDIGFLEDKDVTLEQQLKDDDITIENMPEQEVKESFIKVKQKAFSKEERKRLEKMPNQDVMVTNENHLVISQFKEPVPLTNKTTDEQFQKVIQANMLHGEEYRFGDWNKEKNVIYFFQVKNGRPIYYNSSGIIVVYLNEKNEMVLYTQTCLDEASINSEKKSLIHPVEAVGRLYNSQQIVPGDTVTKMSVGYHTVVPLEDGVQVFLPTWNISVNKEQDFFVNATEGIVFSSDHEEFLATHVSNVLEKIKHDKDISWKKSIVEMLENKMIYLDNRSETD